MAAGEGLPLALGGGEPEPGFVRIFSSAQMHPAFEYPVLQRRSRNPPAHCV